MPDLILSLAVAVLALALLALWVVVHGLRRRVARLGEPVTIVYKTGPLSPVYGQRYDMSVSGVEDEPADARKPDAAPAGGHLPGVTAADLHAAAAARDSARTW